MYSFGQRLLNMISTDFFTEGWHHILWHLWIDPDWRLIECLLLQILTLITLVMSISSLFTITSYIHRHQKVLCHWTVRFSIGLLLLSTMLGTASFILLIYQQNGRHFDYSHIECKIATIILVTFAILFIPIQGISIMAYYRWKSLVEDSGVNTLENVKWYEIYTTDVGADIDLRHLVAVQFVESLDKEEESEQKQTVESNQEEEQKKESNDSKDDNDKNKKMEIVLNAHKTRYKLHFLSLIAQIVLFMTVQFKNYHEEQEKLLKWGYRYSRVIDEDDYWIAKWELENGIVDETHTKQSFESLDWLEYVARSSP